MKLFYNKLFLIILTVLPVVYTSCNQNTSPVNTDKLEFKMNTIAESYVKLVLKVGQFDPNYVDAYYGPEDWKPKENLTENTSALQSLFNESDAILDSLDALSKYDSDELLTLRFRFLYKQILAVKAKIFLLQGGLLSFDEEAKSLYDAAPPVYDNQHFQNIISELDKILPGSGNVSDRLDTFRNKFIIPKDKLDTVFTAAINECRKLTLEKIKLPAEENFKIEYVTGKSWGAYNWYKGNSFSIIQVNTDLPIYIDRAVDLAAHEGYPGHHVYNTLLEKNLFKQKGWVEFSVYPLFSPQSLIAEGTANYGIHVVLPGESRINFEKKVLFPLAGLDSSLADEYYKVLELMSKMNYSSNEAARNYLDGKWTREQTINWLIKFGLRSKERAEQNLKFIETYRSYVINYNLGEDIVKNYIQKNGGTENHPDIRWRLFERLLSLPQTPSGIIK